MTVLLGWSLLLLGTVTPVESGPDWLQWGAPASCPDAESARDATQRRLGREVTISDVTVVATIERHDDEHQLELHITRDATVSTHQLTAQNCRTLAEATGLLVAVVIDPVATVHNMPSALPALPCSASGYPSSTVADEAGVPGVLIRMAGIDPPKMPPL